mgnify:CR=1 FL=1
MSCPKIKKDIESLITLGLPFSLAVLPVPRDVDVNVDVDVYVMKQWFTLWFVCLLPSLSTLAIVSMNPRGCLIPFPLPPPPLTVEFDNSNLGRHNLGVRRTR